MAPLSFKSFSRVYFSLSFSFFMCEFFALGCTVVSSALISLATPQTPFFEADVQL